MTTADPPGGRTSARRAAVASLVGTTVEFYDFVLYGTAAALVFPALYFPSGNATTGLLLSFATFGAGFVARPLGGALFGHFGDTVGRKRMLVLSLAGMGLATVLIGCVPTFDQIGVLAPVLLVVLRIAQGIAVGGEWGGATLMAVEHAPRGRRTLYGAFPMMGAPIGTGLATIAFLIVGALPGPQFLAWGWRLPFLAGAVLIVVGLLVRLSVAETPTFSDVTRRHAVVRRPLLTALRRHRREVLLVAGAYLSQGVVAYVFAAYLVSYGTSVVHLDRSAVLLGLLAACVVAAVLYPLFGRLGDVVGRKTVYLGGLVATAACVWPAFAMVESGDPWLFLVAEVLVAGVAAAPAAGTTGALVTLVFPAQIRYSGSSIGYTLSQVLGSAFAPVIAAALVAATGTSTAVVVYLLATTVVSAISLVLLPGGWGPADVAGEQQHVRPPTVAGIAEPAVS